MSIELHKNESWILYNPLNIENCRAFSAEIIRSEENIIFKVECENKFVNLIFDCFVPVYLYSYEGMRMAAYLPVQEKNNDRYYFTKWFLYKIENSDFLKWAAAESFGLYKNLELKHFCIVTENEVVDILSASEPKFFISAE